MDNGSLVERGTLAEILALNGNFCNLYRGELDFETSLHRDEESEPKSHHHGARNRHVKEKSDASASSSFRPNAPDFVPSHQRSAEASSSQHPHFHTSHEKSHEGTSHHSQAVIADASLTPRSSSKRSQRVSRPSYGSRATSVNKSKPGPPSEEASIHEAGPAKNNTKSSIPAEESKSPYDGTADVITAVKKVPRIKRWHRRRQARSDPQASNVTTAQANNSELVEPQSPSRRRVGLRYISGPGHFPAGASDRKSSYVVPPNSPNEEGDQQPRRRRSKPFRVKKNRNHMNTKEPASTDEPYGASSMLTSSTTTIDRNIASTPNIPSKAETVEPQIISGSYTRAAS